MKTGLGKTLGDNLINLEMFIMLHVTLSLACKTLLLGNIPPMKTSNGKGKLKWSSCFFAPCSVDALQRHFSRGQLCWGWCNPESLLWVRTDIAEHTWARNELELKFCHIFSRLGDLLVMFPRNCSSGQSSFECELQELDDNKALVCLWIFAGRNACVRILKCI